MIRRMPRRPMLALLAGALCLGALCLGAAAAERAVPEDAAAPGEGREVFVARCSICHSVDYIAMHARFGTRALWEAEVAKMRNAFKAPLSDEEAKQVVDYLERAYGPAGEAARASADDRQ